MGEAKRRQEAARALVSQFGDRFWEKVEKTDNCWLWTGAKNRRGYGIFTIDGKQKLAHRIAYFLTRGPLPTNVVLMHACDNPVCVNPSHLVPGTNQQNMEDMLYKGRDPGGQWRKTTVSIQGPLPTEQNGLWRFRVRIERLNKARTGFDFEFQSASRIVPTSLQVLKRVTQLAFGARDRQTSAAQTRQLNVIERKLHIIFGDWYTVELMNCIRAGKDSTHILRKFLQEDSPHTSHRLNEKESE
jgi:hypothetical protein